MLQACLRLPHEHRGSAVGKAAPPRLGAPEPGMTWKVPEPMPPEPCARQLRRPLPCLCRGFAPGEAAEELGKGKGRLQQWLGAEIYLDLSSSSTSLHSSSELPAHSLLQGWGTDRRSWIRRKERGSGRAKAIILTCFFVDQTSFFLSLSPCFPCSFHNVHWHAEACGHGWKVNIWLMQDPWLHFSL